MTASFLLPDPAGPTPLEDTELLDFVQAWLMGLTGLATDLVRPVYQAEPPVVPSSGTIWMAFMLSTAQADTFPFVGQAGEAFQLQRHETLRCLCSFYDTGSTGFAQKYASILRDGTSIPQNLEYLQQQNMAFVACDQQVPVPSLLKQQWLYRVDLPVWLRRQVNRNYTVPTIEIGEAELITSVGITVEIDTSNLEN